MKFLLSESCLVLIIAISLLKVLEDNLTSTFFFDHPINCDNNQDTKLIYNIHSDTWCFHCLRRYLDNYLELIFTLPVGENF